MRQALVLTAVVALVLVTGIWIVTGTIGRGVSDLNDERLVQFVTITNGVSSPIATDQELHVWRDHTSLFESVVARPLPSEPGTDDPAPEPGRLKGAHRLIINGRLKRGATVDMANRQLAVLLAASRRIAPERFRARIAWTVKPL